MDVTRALLKAVRVLLGLDQTAGRGARGLRDTGSWSDPDNDEPVSREMRWNVRDETNYGSEHQTIRDLEAENAMVRQRVFADVDLGPGLAEPSTGVAGLPELDARFAPDADAEQHGA